MSKDQEPMPFDNAQDVMLKSLLRDGMTWTEAKKAVRYNPKLQQVLVELRKGAKDD
jgi:hypothetical protein